MAPSLPLPTGNAFSQVVPAGRLYQSFSVFPFCEQPVVIIDTDSNKTLIYRFIYSGTFLLFMGLAITQQRPKAMVS
jgi:hypothetical protein